MIDSHSHIYLEEFDADRSDVVARARQAGVRHLVLPNVDLDTVEPMMALHRAFPAYTSVAMGLHPTSVGENFRSDLAAVKAIFDRGGFVAVGYHDGFISHRSWTPFLYQISAGADCTHCINKL